MTGTPFVITAADREQIAKAFDWAREHPVPLDLVKAMAAPDKPVIRLIDRPTRIARAPKPREIVLPFGYRVAISCEQQPAGLCLHLSLSAPDAKNRLPIPAACKLIAQACGIERDADQAWIEEFSDNGKLGGNAVNLLYVIDPATVGSA